MGSTGESVKRLADFGYNPSWSPDGREIVVSTASWSEVASRSGQGELWAIDVSSGARRRIETPGDAVQPRWSPHGQRIAYWSVSGGGQRDVFTVAAAGGGAVAVTTDAAIDWDPVWSPDGRRLTFSSDRGGTMNLWRVELDEAGGKVLGPPVPLSVPSGWAGHASLSGDGRTLAYANREVRTTLMRVALDPARGRVSGSAAVVLRGSLELRDQALSPDGEWIAFTTSGREDLFVVRADGTGFRQLTDDAFRDRGVTWSPDGRRLAFYSNREDDYQAFTVRPDGSELKRVTALPGGLTFPSWSPDGAEIASCAGLDEQAWRIDLRQPVGEAAARRLPPIDDDPLSLRALLVARRAGPGRVRRRPRRRVARALRALARLGHLPPARRPGRLGGPLARRGAPRGRDAPERSRSWTRGRARPGASRRDRAPPCRRTAAGSPTWSSPRRPTSGWRRRHEPRGRPPPRPVRDPRAARRRGDGGGLPRPRPPPRARRGDQGAARSTSPMTPTRSPASRPRRRRWRRSRTPTSSRSTTPASRAIGSSW